jgi:hypothetical protein
MPGAVGALQLDRSRGSRGVVSWVIAVVERGGRAKFLTDVPYFWWND